MLANRSVPAPTVIPVLIYPDVRATVAWLGAAFGFVERLRIGENHRSQLTVGADGAVPRDFEYGERQYTAQDPAGHQWTFSQTLADVDPASWGGELTGPTPPAGPGLRSG
jgi:uncharacterized glyoxalase superfamily protein PhnB